MKTILQKIKLNITSRSALTVLAVLIISYGTFAQDGVQIDYTTPTVRDPRAILQLNSANQGFLVPRVASTGDVGIPSTTGVLVYQTGGTAGFYYWDGTAWVMIANTSAGIVTADNGLNVNTGNNVRLGGTISVNPTDIALAGNTLTFSGASNSKVAIGTTSPPNTARLYVESGSSGFDGIRAINTSNSTTGAYAAVKGDVANAAYTNASGQLAYHTTGNITYGVYGNAGDYGGVFARPVSISTVTPTSTSNDLEIRNIAGATPVQVFLRQSVSNTTSGTVLSNLDFGDNNTSTGQARIQVVRDAASSGSSDLPTAIAFSTTADNTSTLLERMRIANSGEVRLVTAASNTRGFLQAVETGTNNGAGGGSGLIIATSGGENIAFKDAGLAGDENLSIMGASGNVGIGATNPQQRLHVAGNARVTALASGASGAIVRSNTSGDLAITNFSGTTTDVLTGAGTFVGISTISGDDWTQSGSNLYPNDLSWNVGIGTSSPSGMLQVGTASNRYFLIGSNGLTTIRFDDNSTPSLLTLENRAITAINNGVNLNFGLNTGGGASLTSGQIKLGAEDNYVTASNRDAYMAFSTMTDGTLAERVRVKSDGNVGIATSAPAYTLQVGQETAGNNTNYSLSISRHGDLATPGTYSGNVPALRVWDVAADGPASAEARGMVDIAAPRIADADANAANAILLGVSNDNGYGLTVKGNRNVGIGTSTPAQRLEVSGNTRITGLASGASGAIVRSNTSGDLAITNFTGTGTDVLTGAGTFVGISTISGDDWTQTGSLLYPNSTTWNVGIGNTSPGFKLDVTGNARIGNTGGVTIASLSASRVNLRPSVSNGDILISDDSGTPARGMTIANGGSVGIATDVPVSMFSVGTTSQFQVNSVGDIRTISNVTPTNGAIRLNNNFLINAASGFATILNFDGGTTGANRAFVVGDGASGTGNFYVYADGQAFTTNWWRSLNNTGWFNQTWGGGWYMDNATHVKSYGDKSVYVVGTGNTLRVDGLKAASGSFYSGSTATTSSIMYANNSTGDIYALPPANNAILVTGATGIPSWQASTGTGVQGYWTRSGTLLYNTNQSDNVGIGTTNPLARLDIGRATSGNKPLLKFHPGTATGIDYNGYAHHDFLMGSYETGGYSQHYISFGYTADPQRKFHIGSADNATFSSAGFAPAFTVMSGGNVGVGNSSPGARFEVRKNDGGNAFRFANFVDGGSLGAWVGTYGAEFRTVTSGATHGMLINHNEANDARRTLDVSDANGVFATFTNGKVGIGNTNPSFKLDVTGTARIGTTGGVAIYSTDANTVNFRPSIGNGDILITDDSGLPARGMTIANGGSVGIGTDAPGRKLEVYGTTPGIKINDPNASGNSFIELSTVDGGLSYFQNVSGRTRIHVGGAERMTFLNNGNVGVGTPSPSRKFTVQRDAGASSSSDIWFSDGTQWEQLNSNSTAGAWSPMVAAGDHTIIYSNGAIETGALTIGQWSNSARGIRIDASGSVRIGNLAGTGNRTVYAASDGTLVSGNTLSAPTSCKQIKDANPWSPNGVYSIDPDGAGALPAVPCYCDMTTNGGGWTKLNSALTSISVNKGTAAWNTVNGEDIQGTGSGTGCGVNRTQYTLSTPSVSFTEVYVLLTRTTSVLQCSAITGGTSYGWYNLPYRGTYNGNGTCLWSDGVWANATDTNMGGLRLNWVMFSNASNTALQYFTECSNVTDNGAFTMQWFVR